jgi:hypothetical protein
MVAGMVPPRRKGRFEAGHAGVFGDFEKSGDVFPGRPAGL